MKRNIICPVCFESSQGFKAMFDKEHLVEEKYLVCPHCHYRYSKAARHFPLDFENSDVLYVPIVGTDYIKIIDYMVRLVRGMQNISFEQKWLFICPDMVTIDLFRRCVENQETIGHSLHETTETIKKSFPLIYKIRFLCPPCERRLYLFLYALLEWHRQEY